MDEETPKEVQAIREQRKRDFELNKKAILLLGILQYQVELLEELMDSRMLSSVFVQQLKRHSKGVIKHSDRILNQMCMGDRDERFKQELQNVYEAVVGMMNSLNWEIKE